VTISIWQRVAQLGVERALNSIPEGLLVAIFAWLLLRVIKGQNAGTRFAVWFSALVAVAVLPFVPRHVAGVAVASASSRQIVLSSFWAVAIFVGWAVIAVVATARLVAGLISVGKLRRQCSAIAPSDLPPALRQTLDEMRLTRPMAICRSRAVTVPTVIGFFKPAILIPEWVLTELSVEELKIILLHECAHLRRRDDWTNLAQKILRAMFFFHPAIWWIEKRLSLEREMACDDLVLATTANSRAYAECLVALAEKSAALRGLAMAQAVISHAREISLRLAQILNVNRPRATSVLKPALVVMSLFGVLSVVVLPDAPILIAFENKQPASVLSAVETSALPGAIVTPASVRIESKSETGLSRGTAVRAKPALAAKAVVAKHVDSQTSSGPLIEAPLGNAVPAQQFLVVMQTTEYDGRGSAVVNFTVWRITFASPAHRAVQRGLVARSI
jgi:beta-lactamase regulating signal transducer with metallopeptidase domain